MTLLSIFTQIVKQYTFTFDSDPDTHNADEYFKEHYPQLLKFLSAETPADGEGEEAISLA